MADRDHAYGIAKVHVASWKHAYRGLLPESYLDYLSAHALAERWSQQLPEAHQASPRQSNAWVIEVQDQVAGFIRIGPCLDDEALTGFAGEIFMLYVHPERTGHGLGSRLLEYAFEVLSRRDYYWSVVWVLEGNTRARSFYERMGLRCDGEKRWDRIMGERVAVIRYAKALNPAVDFDALGQGLVRCP